MLEINPPAQGNLYLPRAGWGGFGGIGVIKKAQDLYRLERFAPERLARLLHEVSSYAEAINGLPKHHGEALEKRGWLLPFLFTYAPVSSNPFILTARRLVRFSSIIC